MHLHTHTRTYTHYLHTGKKEGPVGWRSNLVTGCLPTTKSWVPFPEPKKIRKWRNSRKVNILSKVLLGGHTLSYIIRYSSLHNLKLQKRRKEWRYWTRGVGGSGHELVIYNHKPSGNLCFSSLKSFTYLITYAFVHNYSKVKKNSRCKVCTSNSFSTELIQSKKYTNKQKPCSTGTPILTPRTKSNENRTQGKRPSQCPPAPRLLGLPANHLGEKNMI